MLLECANGDQFYFQFLHFQYGIFEWKFHFRNLLHSKESYICLLQWKDHCWSIFYQRTFLEICDPYAIRVETFNGNGRRKQDQLIMTTLDIWLSQNLSVSTHLASINQFVMLGLCATLRAPPNVIDWKVAWGLNGKLCSEKWMAAEVWSLIF